MFIFSLGGFHNSFKGFRGIFNSYNVLFVLNIPISFIVNGIKELISRRVSNEEILFHISCVTYFYLGIIQWTIVLGTIFPLRKKVVSEREKIYYQKLADKYGPISNIILIILISLLLLSALFFLVVI
jgi:hypothetical protein